MLKRWCLLASFCAALLGAFSAANAASFDCSKAITPRDHLICSNAQLSDLDAQLGRVYASAVAHLSQTRAKLLQSQQREWLRYVGDACPVSVDTNQWNNQWGCIAQNYNQRIRDFEQVGLRKRPFLFTRVDHYAVTHLRSKSDANDTGLALHHVAYPRIDQPATPVITGWNALMLRQEPSSSCDIGDGNTSVDYKIGLATTRLISVSWTTWEYCHGTPHGFGGTTVQNIVLTPEPHPLQAADLFRPDTPWKERLNGLLTDAVQKAASAGNFRLLASDTDTIGTVATSPARWSLSEQGLSVAFNPYELCCYVFHPDIIIPWSDLRDILIEDPAAP